MSFEWSQYLRLADWLAVNPSSGGNDEASQRSAISRAYYAAYCSARNQLESSGERRRSGGHDDHRELSTYLQRSYKTTPRAKAGLRLGRLYRARCQADYDNSISNLPATTQDALATARDILQLVPQFGRV